ncbi:putative ribonuclease H protein [Acorus calamus]|uniref:Ribonuclease H protein n=1 Tax=Acorus calamus TaxID=4465 RepID=A0AAV9EVJ0_ACOCL|nr:putative ribonuclease H protein [Acorus calamus]
MQRIEGAVQAAGVRLSLLMSEGGGRIVGAPQQPGVPPLQTMSEGDIIVCRRARSIGMIVRMEEQRRFVDLIREAFSDGEPFPAAGSADSTETNAVPISPQLPMPTSTEEKKDILWRRDRIYLGYPEDVRAYARDGLRGWNNLCVLARGKQETEGRAEEAWEGNGWRLRFLRAPTLAESTQATGLARMTASAPLVTGSSDRVRWGRRGHEEYTVRRGYRWWRRSASHRPEMVALQGLIWRSAAPLKIKIFVWLVGQERILTKVYCAKWNPDISTQCVLCNGGEETVDHLFRECMAARGLWLRLGARCNHRLNYPSMGEFWEATRKLTCRGDRSLEAKDFF